MDMKLDILRDMYSNGMSYNFTAKKYGLSSIHHIKSWEERISLHGKALSLSDEVIQKVKAMKTKREKKCSSQVKTREEILEDKIRDLEKALKYSELRVEAYSELIRISEENLGVDILKKAGAKQ